MENKIQKIIKETINKFIKNKLNENNFNWRGYYNYEEYQAEDADELMEYSLLKPKFSGLNVDLYIDDGGAYIRHEHPLWVYFRNGYSKNDNVLPVSIDNNPQILVSNYNLNISKFDLDSIKEFIRQNANLLVSFANDELSHIEFFDNIKVVSYALTENKMLLQEMATIKSRDSGLPVDIWVDEDKQFEGHAPRIKFKASKEQKTTREFSTMTISDEPKVINLPQKYDIDSKSIELVRKFVLYNKDLLLELIRGNIDYHTDFLPQMIKITQDGKPIYPNNIINYEGIMKCQNGFIMVKSNINTFNFLNKENKLITPNQWYENAEPYTLYQNDYYAMVKINDEWIWIDEKGNILTIN